MGEIVAIVVSFASLLLIVSQTRLLRRAIEAQTYTTLLERARDIRLSSTVDFINSLDCTDYATFQETVSPERQEAIRTVADFFNDISHLIRNDYLDQFYPIRVYRPMLLTCAWKLMPWWLDGVRTSRGIPSVYGNFKWMCEYTLHLEKVREIKDLSYIPQIGYRDFLEDRGYYF